MVFLALKIRYLARARTEEKVDYPTLIGKVYSASDFESKYYGMIKIGSKLLRLTVASVFSQDVSLERKMVFQKNGIGIPSFFQKSHLFFNFRSRDIFFKNIGTLTFVSALLVHFFLCLNSMYKLSKF